MAFVIRMNLVRHPFRQLPERECCRLLPKSNALTGELLIIRPDTKFVDLNFMSAFLQIEFPDQY
mgnify:CR=1 FL=1